VHGGDGVCGGDGATDERRGDGATCESGRAGCMFDVGEAERLHGEPAPAILRFCRRRGRGRGGGVCFGCGERELTELSSSDEGVSVSLRLRFLLRWVKG